LEIEESTRSCIASIFSEIHDLLTGIRLIQDFSPRTRDLLMSFGERLSIRIVSGYLNKIGVVAKYFDAWDIGLRTTRGSGSTKSLKSGVEVLPESYDNIFAVLGDLNNNYVFTPIISGFIAKDLGGTVTTLGRSGSDLSASLVGVGIGASEIEIWTDTDGILTCDPRIVPNARTLKELTFEQAAELAFFGAKVLHPGTIAPAVAKGIAVRVKNSYNPDLPGTLILPYHANLSSDNTLATAVTCKRNVTVVDISSMGMLGAHGFLARVFTIFDHMEISVDMIATSEVSVSVTLDDHPSIEKIEKLMRSLKEVARVTIKEDMAILTLICNVSRSNELLAMACYTLKDLMIPVEMVSCGASKVNVSVVVPNSHAEMGMRALHATFFEDKFTPRVQAASSCCSTDLD